MNEQIKQLWEQAAKTTQGDSLEEQTKFIERFAQLIVQECAKVSVSGDPLLDGSIGKMIREHFGVTQ